MSNSKLWATLHYFMLGRETFTHWATLIGGDMRVTLCMSSIFQHIHNVVCIQGMVKNYKNVLRFQLLMEHFLACWIDVLDLYDWGRLFSCWVTCILYTMLLVVFVLSRKNLQYFIVFNIRKVLRLKKELNSDVYQKCMCWPLVVCLLLMFFYFYFYR